jgi:hypothetical protein
MRKWGENFIKLFFFKQILQKYEDDLIEKKIEIKKDIKRLKKKLRKVKDELEGVRFTLHILYGDCDSCRCLNS